jgi:Fuc2NAc and GlcNAc transferase
MGFFMVDTTLTLMTRMLTKQKFSQAHRSHMYQILWQKLNANHFMVTCLVMLINIFWLLPWAYAVSHEYVSAMMGLLISYFPLVIMGLIFKAGRLTG